MSNRVWTDGEVHAAGGLVLRDGRVGTEVLVVHRPHRSDWSFPKGHLEAGETAEEAALREVAEEAGLQCALGMRLSSAHYIDHQGHPKVVDYWTMSVRSGSFAANDEVDEVAWLTFDQAAERLTYEIDRHLIGELVGLREA